MQGIEIKKLDKKVDERGCLVKLLMQQELKDARQEFGEIYITTAKPGVVKGNHYHPLATEWFFIISGQGKLALCTAEGERRDISLSGDDPTIVKVPAGIRHAIKNVGTEDLALLAYADHPYNPSDTIPADIRF